MGTYKRFKVAHFVLDTYELSEIDSYYAEKDMHVYNIVFRGSIVECEAFIRLREMGYIEAKYSH